MTKLNCLRQVFLLALFILYLAPISALANNGQEFLVITNSKAWPPFSFLNEDGEPRGLLIDLWQTYGQYNNKKIIFRLVDWEMSLDLMKRKQADVHAGLFKNDVRDAYLDFSSPLNIPLATRLFISKKLKVSGISNLESIPVGVTKGGFAALFIHENYPSMHLHYFPNSRETVKAAIDGDIFAFISDYPAAMYYLHKFGSPENFHVVDTLYREDLRAAVFQGNDKLLDVITEGFDRIPPEEFDRIVLKWIHSEPRLPEWLLPTFIIILGILIFAFVVAYIYVLKREVMARTEELIKLTLKEKQYNKKLSSEVEKKAIEIQHKNEMIFNQHRLVCMGEMIANIAHQWRQPLASLNGIFIRLDDRYKNNTLDNEIFENYLNDAESLTTYMSNTIEDFSHFFSPKKTKETFDVNMILLKSKSMQDPTLKQSAIVLELNIQGELLINSYPSELMQVIFTLVNNAKDALIKCDSKDKKITIKSYQKEKIIFIEVYDNGEGIDDKLLNKIFDPYFTTKYKSQGTGLGLYIAKLVIEMSMNGILSVYNNERGAVFTIELYPD